MRVLLNTVPVLGARYDASNYHLFLSFLTAALHSLILSLARVRSAPFFSKNVNVFFAAMVFTSCTKLGKKYKNTCKMEAPLLCITVPTNLVHNSQCLKESPRLSSRILGTEPNVGE